MENILVVDDESDLRDILVEKLEKKGFHVERAASGYEAMKLVDKKRPDLIISDYSMQDGDGGSLAHFCESKNIPCIVVTGFESKDVKPYMPSGVPVVEKHSLDDLINLVLKPKS